jgi:hypothetical protein
MRCIDTYQTVRFGQNQFVLGHTTEHSTVVVLRQAGPSDRNYLQAPAEPWENWRVIFCLCFFLLSVHGIIITMTKAETSTCSPFLLKSCSAKCLSDTAVLFLEIGLAMGIFSREVQPRCYYKYYERQSGNITNIRMQVIGLIDYPR